MGQRLAIYARLSQDRDGAQTATARQIADCRALAGARGWPVADVYEDTDLTAYRRVNRPGYERLLADLEKGKVDAVLVWKLDRLVRHPAEFERFWAVCERRGATLASVHEPVDTSSELGLVIVRILVAFARLESATISLRQKSKAAELAKAGRPHTGGRRAFGFAPDWRSHEPAEAELIRDAARRVLAGASVNSIAKDWNKQGVHSPAGNSWRASSLLRLLRSPHLAGFRRHHGVIVGEGNWPPILDRDTFERLALALAREHGRPLGLPRRYVLTGGIARCGLCDAPLMARPNKAGSPRYICAKAPGRPGCGGITVSAEPLEAFVAEAIFTALDSPSFSAALHSLQVDDHNATLAEALHADEEALEQLHVDHYVDRIIDRAGFIVAKRALEERITKAREELARRSRRALLADLPRGAAAARAAWDRQDVEWRHAFVKVFLEAVRVHRGRPGRLPFNPERVELMWRV
jgi:site-specific DNA recombinase